MKKLLIFYGLLISTSLTGNPVVDMLNKMHKVSNKYWKHQREDDLEFYSLISRKKGFIEPTIEEDPEHKYVYQKRDDIPPFRIGGAVEGVGELADIATTVISSPKLMRIANMLALVSRASDVSMGSFPELPRTLVDKDGVPTSDLRRVCRCEKPLLRFLPTLWMDHQGEKEEFGYKRYAPLYLASLGINQVGKAFDIKRAYDRVKNARLLAWYNSTLSKKKRMRLHIEQVVHAALLIAGLVTKYKQEQRYVTDRYPWLIGEALVSFLRRWRMQHVQNDLLDRARMAAEHEGKKF